jgi:ribosome-binding protein aMBF1 (putative translation factor)
MTFAEKLKSIRKQAGMSQEQLAEKLGVSRQAVQRSAFCPVMMEKKSVSVWHRIHFPPCRMISR